MTPPPDDSDAVVVAQVVSQAAAAELPLAEALRAAADDLPSARLAAVLRRIAAELDRGRPLEDICREPRFRLLRYLQHLMATASRGGDPAAALTEWLDTQRAVQRTWRSVAAAVLYPIVLLALAVMLVIGLNFVLIGPLLRLYEDFELTLPQLTQVLVWFCHQGLPSLLIGGAAVGAGLAVYRLIGGAARWRRFLESLPIVGMLWHWTSVMELARLLAVLLRREVPLPEALQLAAEGVQSPAMRQVTLRLADGVRQGSSLADVLDATYRLPATLVPIVRWGERTGRLDEAFAVAGRMFADRAAVRADLIASLLPPLVFVILAVTIPLFVLGLYAPMVTLIQSLS